LATLSIACISRRLRKLSPTRRGSLQWSSDEQETVKWSGEPGQMMKRPHRRLDSDHRRRPGAIHRDTTEIMPIRPIIRYPDPRLALAAQPVTVFDPLRDLAQDLLDTMHAVPGIGITAPHIGIFLQVVVLDLDPIDGARTYVNPEIIWASPEMIMHQEGSVSMPGVNDEIMRHARIRIRYHDINGELQTEESEGLRAVCHQHEIDQLNGLFWIKRLSRLKRERLIKRFEKALRS
jgi:peptide deformylase